MDLREFLTKRMIKNSGYKVRVFDLDGYEHLSFTLRKNTDFDKFNNVFDQDMLDADTHAVWDCVDEEEHTIFIRADIEL